MVHRAIFGSFERFIAILTEHYQGSFPIWLSPVQAIVLPISDKNLGYANKVAKELKSEGFRTEVDTRNETLQAKIRDAIIAKIPYLLVVGGKEEEANSVAVRTREGKNTGAITLSQFKEDIAKDIGNKV